MPRSSTSPRSSSSNRPTTARASSGPTSTRAGLGVLLQPRGQIDGVAQRVEALAVVARLPVDHHPAGLDRDPPGERQVVVGAHLLAEAVELALQLDPGQHRALGVVVVGLGRAEHRQHAVPGELGDGPAEASHLEPRSGW